jgi:hypothetical protein
MKIMRRYLAGREIRLRFGGRETDANHPRLSHSVRGLVYQLPPLRRTGQKHRRRNSQICPQGCAGLEGKGSTNYAAGSQRIGLCASLAPCRFQSMAFTCWSTESEYVRDYEFILVCYDTRWRLICYLSRFLPLFPLPSLELVKSRHQVSLLRNGGSTLFIRRSVNR